MTFREETIRRARERLAEIRDRVAELSQEARDIVATLEALGEIQDGIDLAHEFALPEVEAQPEPAPEPPDVPPAGPTYPTIEQVRDFVLTHRDKPFAAQRIAAHFGWDRPTSGSRILLTIREHLRTLEAKGTVRYNAEARGKTPRWSYNSSFPAGPTSRPRGEEVGIRVPDRLRMATGRPVAGTGRGSGGTVGHKWLREVRSLCKPDVLMSIKPSGHIEFRLGRRRVVASATPRNEDMAKREVLRDLRAREMLA